FPYTTLFRSAFVTGRMNEAQVAAENILNRIQLGMTGYESVSGRTAAYVLAFYNQNYFRNLPKAKEYYQQAMRFSESTKDTKAGYYLSSILSLGKIAQLEKDAGEAQRYYRMVLDNSDKKSSYYKDARNAM